MAQIAVGRLDDPRLDPYRDVRDKDLRGRDDVFMAESDLVVRRLLRTPERLVSLLLSPTRAEAMADELAALPESVPVFIADVALMTRIAGFHIHRGALAVGIRPRPEALRPDRVFGAFDADRPCTILVAEGLTNVDNIGALFRNAAGFGVDGILLDPTCCDPLYRKAIRVSMGHVLSIPWAVSQSWPEDLVALREQLGLRLVAAESVDGARPLREMPDAERMAIVLGSESCGISPAVLELCDDVLEVPMAASVPSLNVAVASAIFLYERRR